MVRRLKEDTTHYFPMFIDLREKHILIVGAGKVALRRIRTLRSFGAFVTVLTAGIPEYTRVEMEALRNGKELQLINKQFAESDLNGPIDIVIAATDDEKLNQRIYDMCKKKSIWVNVASNRELCDFYFPAVAQNETLVIGITGNGKNHEQVAKAAADARKYLAGCNRDNGGMV